MHAAVIRVSIGDPGQAQQGLEQRVIPRAKGMPGFVAGYWTRSEDGRNGQSLVVFESEDGARQFVEGIQSSDAEMPETVTLESAEVREVVASA